MHAQTRRMPWAIKADSSVDSHFETKYKISGYVKHGEEDSMYVAGPGGYVEEGTLPTVY